MLMPTWTTNVQLLLNFNGVRPKPCWFASWLLASLAVLRDQAKRTLIRSRFEHSTEPGCGRDGEAHAYLCFTFGTDDEAAWPRISRTLGTQSRVVMHPDGTMRLSALGESIETAVQEQLQQQAAAAAEYVET